MSLLWRSPTAWSPESTSGDFIFNLAIAHSGNLEIGTRQLTNWRLHVPPDFLPICQPGALSTRLHCSRMPRHHTRPPGRYIILTSWAKGVTSVTIVENLAKKLTNVMPYIVVLLNLLWLPKLLLCNLLLWTILHLIPEPTCYFQ